MPLSLESALGGSLLVVARERSVLWKLRAIGVDHLMAGQGHQVKVQRVLLADPQ